MEGNRCGFSGALEYLRDKITIFAPQGPLIHLHEEDKVYYPSDVVLGLDRAQSSITQCATATPSWNFHQLNAALDSSIVLAYINKINQT